MTTSVTGSARKAALAFIFVTVVIDVLSFGVIIPVLPRLIVEFQGGDTALAAETYGLFTTAWSAMQFLCSPLMGALSDRYGRRPVILISAFGLAADFLLMALAPTLGWLLLGRIISGITASSFSVSGAYVADITPPDKRAAGFGVIGAAFGVGFIVGPALGGVLGEVSPRLPFFVAAVLSLSSAAYGLFILPESLPLQRRAPLTLARANPVGALSMLRSHPGLSGLAVLNVLFQFAHYSLPAAFVLYTGHRYGFSATVTGFTLTGSGVLSVLVQGFLVKRFVRRWGERRAALTGLAGGALGFAGMALAPSAGWLWAAMPVFALMGLFTPGLQSLMTQRVQATEQGRLQGVNTSLVGIAGLLAPATFTLSFAAGIRPGGIDLPGAPFLIASSLLAVGFIVALRTARPMARG